MAQNADSVVVEVLAKVDGFDTPIKQSAANFNQAMTQISSAATGTERAVTASFSQQERALAKIAGPAAEAALRQRRLAEAIEATGAAHAKSGLAANQNRIGLLELQHVLRGSADSFASGTPPAQIFAQHVASIGEAAVLSGGSLGKVGAILSGPWGLAFTAGIAVLATFFARQKDAGDATENLVDKLKKHYEQTQLNIEAQRIYDKTVEGSIEAMNKLTAEIDKQNLTLEDNIALKKASIAGSLADVVGNIGTISAKLSQAVAAEREARRVLADIQSGALQVGENPAAAELSQQSRLQDAHKLVVELTAQLFGLSAAAEAGGKALRSVDFPLIERNAKAAADEVAQINLRYDHMADAAKKAGTYTQQLADSIEKQRQAAIKLAQVKPADPIAQFKSAVIGAEGTGANQLGSSAAGFGQFMPSTFLSYFNRLFPDKASLDDAAKLQFRNVRAVAEAVIDKATADYVEVIKHAGAAVTAANLYAVHLLGQRDATRLFNAAPGADTSSFLSAAVLRGNPFLRGTAANAQAAIARRIGDSSSAVSQGAVAIEQAITSEREKQEKALDKALSTESEVTLEKHEQASIYNLIDEYQRNLTRHTIEGAAAEQMLKQHLAEMAANLDAAREVGLQFVDDVLNPDNWTSFGDVAKRVLHDIEKELITLAAINPLKNLINGDNKLPTLLGSLTSLFGGFDSKSFALTEQSNAVGLGLPANFFGGHAAGGMISGPGSATSDSIPAMLSDGEFVMKADAVKRLGVSTLNALNDGKVKLFSDGGAVRRVNPSNDAALSPYGGGAGFRVQVVRGELFDAIISSLATSAATPLVAQGSIRAAQGGATMARRNLARESLHRLD